MLKFNCETKKNSFAVQFSENHTAITTGGIEPTVKKRLVIIRVYFLLIDILKKNRNIINKKMVLKAYFRTIDKLKHERCIKYLHNQKYCLKSNDLRFFITNDFCIVR